MKQLPTAILAVTAFAGVLVSAGCGADLLSFSDPQQPTQPIGRSMSDCPPLASNVTLSDAEGDPIITKVCFLDDEGNYYPSGLSDADDAVLLLPGGREYTVVYELASAWLPSDANVSSASFVYAAPEALPGPLDCINGQLPEENAANLIASSTTLQADVLTQTIASVVPDGEQLVPELDLATLYSGSDAGFFGNAFNLRAYIGSVPPCGRN